MINLTDYPPMWSEFSPFWEPHPRSCTPFWVSGPFRRFFRFRVFFGAPRVQERSTASFALWGRSPDSYKLSSFFGHCFRVLDPNGSLPHLHFAPFRPIAPHPIAPHLAPSELIASHPTDILPSSTCVPPASPFPSPFDPIQP